MKARNNTICHSMTQKSLSNWFKARKWNIECDEYYRIEDDVYTVDNNIIMCIITQKNMTFYQTAVYKKGTLVKLEEPRLICHSCHFDNFNKLTIFMKELGRAYKF